MGISIYLCPFYLCVCVRVHSDNTYFIMTGITVWLSCWASLDSLAPKNRRSILQWYFPVRSNWVFNSQTNEWPKFVNDIWRLPDKIRPVDLWCKNRQTYQLSHSYSYLVNYHTHWLVYLYKPMFKYYVNRGD